MTGFGIASAENDSISVTVEVKSLNSKFLDLSLKLPKEYSDKDIEVRNLISNTLERGKVAFSVEVEQKGETKPKVTINREIVKQYFQDLKETAAYIGAQEVDLFKIALTLPKAIDSDQDNEINVEEWQFILKVMEQAIKKCQEFRESEGKNLEQKFQDYIENINSRLKKIEDQDPLRIKNIRERIQKSFQEYGLGEQVDNNRFEQELIYYLEKLDISEEKVRLQNHLDYFLETMASKDANGKKLGFISQEVGREINTIGSKVNDSSIQRLVVEMKDELEKIKEQVLNIL